MPAPIAPWISASEALTIWMFSTAMKAPSVAPITAIQVLAGIAGAAAGAGIAEVGGGSGIDGGLKCGHGSLLVLRQRQNALSVQVR